MSTNADSVVPNNDSGSGEFSSRVQPSEPMTTHGHQPGVNVGNDAKPEFSAETLPAGTAPAGRTFQPQNDADIPSGGKTTAAETIGGATSGDVNVVAEKQ